MPEHLIGHRLVFSNLAARELPAVTLLLGPEGTGKWLLALDVADFHGYPKHDTYANKGPLVAEHVRTVQAFCRTAASTPLGKLVLVCLDGAEGRPQNALLKLLEEPPGSVKFILVAGMPPLPTIVSRSFVQRCGLLAASEVEQVLLQHGYEPAEAAAAALLAGGRVSTVPHTAAATADVLGRVKAALKAASDRNPLVLGCISARVWDDAHHLLLQKWAAEHSSWCWAVFSPRDAPGLSREDARYVLEMLSVLGTARPWLADRAVLENLAART